MGTTTPSPEDRTAAVEVRMEKKGEVGVTSAGVKTEDTDVKMTEGEDSESGRKFVDDISGVEIPGYVDSPILELGFAGMVLHIRQSREYSLHNDALAVIRDYKKRQSRFKQENIRSAEKLFLLTKSEARMALDASLRSHKIHNRYPIPFPRGLGRAVPLDTGVPFSKDVVSMGPPSLESYLIGLGLRPKHFERDLPPLMPTLDAKTRRRVAISARDASFERATEHRERARLLLRNAYRHGNNANAPSMLFREGKRRPAECDSCFATNGNALGSKAKSPRLPEPLIKREPPLIAALTAAKARVAERASNKEKKEGWFDPIWNCWRIGEGPSVQ
ncbi:unnamed protein product [Chondrus crispus]|uniref:Uncharacterized protein n=1 Tax=Chondrus crispus TaxID=2769 RepID=R7Q7D9_CHOCR|nr:unnamed protein product [Chondrus crispus]CDF33748.1 unnamed protein product [Chondrus crispus]|eukprot:XP_005713567.1 unnamed protein product [Chondrus crispus]